MKFIRFLFISLVVMFVIATFIGLLMPSTVLVSRAVNIHATRDSIISHVNDIQKWRTWVAGLADTAIKIESASYAIINGTKVTITAITDSTVRSEWTTQNGRTQIASLQLIGSNHQPITVVQWQFEEKVNWYPWERLGSMMNDKIIGPLLETNLNNLRMLCEK